MLCLDHLIKIVDNKLKKAGIFLHVSPSWSGSKVGWPVSRRVDKKWRSLSSWVGAGLGKGGGGQKSAQAGDAGRDVMLSPVSTAQGQQTEAGPS